MKKEDHSYLNDILMLIIAICLVCICLISCKSVQYVPVPSVKTETVYKNTLRVDSVYLRDSIYLHEYTKGDTVYIDKVVDRWRGKKKEVHDTVYISKTDSVRVPYPVEVEKELTFWEQTKLSLGGVAILVCAIYILSQLVWHFKKGE